MNDDEYGAYDRDGDQEMSEESYENSLDEPEGGLDSDEKENNEEEYDEDNDYDEEDDKVDIITDNKIVHDTPNEVRITPPFLTKYEKARVIGVRATQIAKNSPLYLNADDKDLSHWDPLYIAEKELSEKKIPFKIRRYLPDSSFEDWKLYYLRMLY